MKILIPPAFRYFAFFLCAAAIALPQLGTVESYPALKANQYQVLTCLFCAGLFLFALAGKVENKEHRYSARKKALRETLGWLVLIVPVMAFANRAENGSLNWFSPAEVAFAGLSFFTLIATFYFYNDKKLLAAK